MYKTDELALTDVESTVFFKIILFFYPAPFRKRFGEQMLLVLSDMYYEELENNGRVGSGFWIVQFTDLSKSVIAQHIDYLGTYGIKKYSEHVLHITTYNALGIFFLLPFVSVFLLDIALRILQGNLLRPNTLILHGLYTSPLYWFPILFTWVFLFPMLAVLLNVVALIASALKNKKTISNLTFFRKNLITVVVLFVALSAVALLFLHDFMPCLLNSFLSQGIFKVGHIISVCRNA